MIDTGPISPILQASRVGDETRPSAGPLELNQNGVMETIDPDNTEPTEEPDAVEVHRIDHMSEEEFNEFLDEELEEREEAS